MNYDQPEKDNARAAVLMHAIRSLTSAREDSSIVNPEIMKRNIQYCRDHMLNCKIADIFQESQILECFGMWKELYVEKVGSKSPSELAILFLCGPDPRRDLNLMMDCGIRPQNIWAVEGGVKEAASAERIISEENLPVKLYQGSLKDFFEVVPQRFDIVYYDACKAIDGKSPNSLDVLHQLFVSQRLTDLSVLITNFTEGDFTDAHIENWINRLSAWYITRTSQPVEFKIEPHLAPKEFQKHIRQNILAYYSDFVSNFIAEFSSVMVPAWRISALSASRKAIFDESKLSEAIKKSLTDGKGKNLDEVLGSTGHPRLAPEAYKHLWFAELLRLNCKDSDPFRRLFESKWKLATLSESLQGLSLVRMFYDGYIDWAKHNQEACSAKLGVLLHKFRWFDSEGQQLQKLFCDIPFPNLLVDLITGIYGYPFHANLKASSRYRYVAKTRPMYSDVFVLDKARYLYDLLPTPNCFSEEQFFEYQLIIRCCIDSIGRHATHEDKILFRGSALAGFGDAEDFSQYTFSDRINLNGD